MSFSIKAKRLQMSENGGLGVWNMKKFYTCLLHLLVEQGASVLLMDTLAVAGIELLSFHSLCGLPDMHTVCVSPACAAWENESQPFL